MIKCCSLYSGSSGNCTYVGDENTNILIDAGTSCKKINLALENLKLSIKDINAILITHEHSDHIFGINVISSKYKIPIYATKLTWNAMENKTQKIPIENKCTFEKEKEFQIGTLRILPFEIPHDATDPCGFNIFKDNFKATVATDIGHITKPLLEKLEKSDILLIESNHDKNILEYSQNYPFYLKKRILGKNGHLSNDTTAKLIKYLANTGMKNFILAHLSNENNFPELAYQTVASALNEIGIKPNENGFNLSVAPKNEPSIIHQLM